MIFAPLLMLFPSPQLELPKPAQRDLQRVNYHRVTSKRSPAPEPGAENTPLLSPLVKADNRKVKDADEWYRVRRLELLQTWLRILGKVEPAPEDLRWFG